VLTNAIESVDWREITTSDHHDAHVSVAIAFRPVDDAIATIDGGPARQQLAELMSDLPPDFERALRTARGRMTLDEEEVTPRERVVMEAIKVDDVATLSRALVSVDGGVVDGKPLLEVAARACA
jgi:regulator of protease activity HflC (stomatin/prohibitin superfamily)